MATSTPRVRFAPSPTGYLHIGGARTALYNYLLAKRLGGTFILRIEDTDLERSTPESIEAILEGLQWLGLNWDEGPYYQTKRFDLYNQYIDKLIDEGKAYPCFCTPEILASKREAAMKEKRKPMYDRACLKLSPDEVQNKKNSGQSYCIRFKSPDEGAITIQDVIKGEVVVAHKELDDLVIRRTDGSPTYNFTVVIDDATMGVTHVIRGDDHLNNTPRQIQLYEALGFPLPTFAHVPMILGADKKRLSKRHGATSVMAYRDMGFLPEAVLNYLVRLGWSNQDQEVFTLEDMCQKFNLESCSTSAAIFNTEKLLWLNGLYIRDGETKRLTELTKFHLAQKGLTNCNQELLFEAVKASQPKVKTLVELADMVDFFFTDSTLDTIDEKSKEKITTDDAKRILNLVKTKLDSLENWLSDDIHKAFESLSTETGLGLGKLAGPTRLVLTGKPISPGIYDIVRLLGKAETSRRIAKWL